MCNFFYLNVSFSVIQKIFSPPARSQQSLNITVIKLMNSLKTYIFLKYNSFSAEAEIVLLNKNKI